MGTQGVRQVASHKGGFGNLHTVSVEKRVLQDGAYDSQGLQKYVFLLALNLQQFHLFFFLQPSFTPWKVRSSISGTNGIFSSFSEIETQGRAFSKGFVQN